MLGTIMSVVALEDLKAGSEVLCNYGYQPESFLALNLTISEQECSKVNILCNIYITIYNILITHCRECASTLEGHESYHEFNN